MAYDNNSGLKLKCLEFKDLFAQSIATIGPSGGPLVAIPMVAASAGNGTWLSFAIAVVGVIFIGKNINSFAREYSGTGSLYGYIIRGIGPRFGIIGAWALVIAYIACAASVAPLFASYLNVIINPIGIYIPSVLIIGIVSFAAWFLAWKDISLSSKVMLYIEIASLIIGVILAFIVVFKLGSNVDTAQLNVKAFSGSGVMQGTILAFMCMVGFESATMLGDEAKNPLKNIPKAVTLSAFIAGLYYIVNSYVYISAFRFLNDKYTTSQAPVTEVATHFGVSALAVLLTIGAVVSSLAVVLASINAGARGLYEMSKNGILNENISNTHKKNRTPHVAIGVVSIITFVLPTILTLSKVGLSGIWGLVGSISSLGFLTTYLLIDIAAPIFLYHKKKLRPTNIIISVIGGISVLIPFIGSVYPIPPYPNNLLVYIFIVLLASGFIRFLWKCRKQPDIILNIKLQLDDAYNSSPKERKSQYKDKNNMAI
ncbi:APC family permease [Clostridium sp. Mt-5]|uniref:APC family permease n=1 Tax=Clostridium moutaii TaxID=3240932 RepID=A0ABV4BK88_9CLOT